ncbi:unnamed protein product [Parascedosporium putredinis]|uniref:Vacuolar protein sorting-associated protein 17 n=1 Tax=Parascedosporium putredinis TaxID=1442378 RepID=A0A9P1H7G2_9PEZI|nr:unnamed protein product [Parascedosporium putredinis]CAI7998847.1 unnamed protein product [Parascedosporium putredinis]
MDYSSMHNDNDEASPGAPRPFPHEADERRGFRPNDADSDAGDYPDFASSTTARDSEGIAAHHEVDDQQPPATPQKPQGPSRPAEPGQASQTEEQARKPTTNLPRFRTTQYRDVRRLHSEFVKLAEHLISANPEAFVPAVPAALTSAGAGTEEDEVRVKALMQRWLSYVCSSETLMRDDEMVLFVESDFGYSPMVKMKQPATGVRRKILKQFAPSR